MKAHYHPLIGSQDSEYLTRQGPSSYRLVGPGDKKKKELERCPMVWVGVSRSAGTYIEERGTIRGGRGVTAQ